MDATTATGLDDTQKTDIKAMAVRYRDGVRRGDFGPNWAAEDCAGKYTYPYATASHFSNVRAYAAKFVR